MVCSTWESSQSRSLPPPPETPSSDMSDRPPPNPVMPRDARDADAPWWRCRCGSVTSTHGAVGSTTEDPSGGGAGSQVATQNCLLDAPFSPRRRGQTADERQRRGVVDLEEHARFLRGRL